MAFQIGTNTIIDNDRIVKLTSGATGSRPGSPSTGMMFFNTTSGKIEVWNGSAWKEAIASASGEINPLWAWGYNLNGRLGDGTITNRSSPVSVVGGFTDWIQVDVGSTHAVAIRANGTAWAWGTNLYGKLGDGTTSNRSSPVSVVGGFTDWVQILSARNHTVGIRTNGTVWAWGDNFNGRLGDGTTSNQSSPVSVVGGFTNWVQISAGSIHTAAIRANGTAWGWGDNGNGRLGDGTTSDRSSPVSVLGGFTDWTQISAGNSHTAAIRANGTAWAWGSNISAALGDNTLSSRTSPVSVVGGFTDWTQISAGNSHTAAIRANGTAWAWGSNFGRLGDGTGTARSSPVSVVGGFTNWVQISAGVGHTVAIRTNGTAWAWGSDNSFGQLGDGTTSSRTSPVSVIGGFTDWVQVSAGVSNTFGIRSQPIRNLNKRNPN